MSASLALTPVAANVMNIRTIHNQVFFFVIFLRGREYAEEQVRMPANSFRDNTLYPAESTSGLLINFGVRTQKFSFCSFFLEQIKHFDISGPCFWRFRINGTILQHKNAMASFRRWKLKSSTFSSSF